MTDGVGGAELRVSVSPTGPHRYKQQQLVASPAACLRRQQVFFRRDVRVGVRPVLRSSMDRIGVSFLDPLEDYELIHRIGCGTYGDVFKVSRCLSLKTDVWTS